MNNNSFYKSILIVLSLVLLISCDSGFNEVGTDIVSDNNFSFKPESKEVLAFNQSSGAVQSNNLSVNALGIYNNPAFGTTTANFVTQVQLASVNPTIDLALAPVIDSVILKIPYYSTKVGFEDDGVTGKYELDSIYGAAKSKLKLGVYESGYFLRDIDPNTLDEQAYYSNQNSIFDSNKGQLLNTSASSNENEDFVFSEKETREDTKDSNSKLVTTRSAPSMRLSLDKNFFQNKIFSSAASGKLVTNDVFKNYFRGLYFKVEKSSTTTTQLAMMNFKGGTVTVYYKENTSSSNSTKVNKTIALNLTGNCVNLFQNDYLPEYTNAVSSPNSSEGDTKLYLKGGEGSMAVINLFGVGELEQLRARNLLINDASLTFTIDNSNVSDEPNRIYLYDLNNKKSLADYSSDITTRSAQKYNKYVHGGIIKIGSDKKGIQYKIKLTNHIRNLVKNDTVTNVKLGLVVTENINDVSFKKVANPVYSGKIVRIPTSSVMSPLGTIIYGSNSTVPEDKRLKFEIYYTEPKQN